MVRAVTVVMNSDNDEDEEGTCTEQNKAEKRVSFSHPFQVGDREERFSARGEG